MRATQTCAEGSHGPCNGRWCECPCHSLSVPLNDIDDLVLLARKAASDAWGPDEALRHTRRSIFRGCGDFANARAA